MKKQNFTFVICAYAFAFAYSVTMLVIMVHNYRYGRAIEQSDMTDAEIEAISYQYGMIDYNEDFMTEHNNDLEATYKWIQRNF